MNVNINNNNNSSSNNSNNNSSNSSNNSNNNSDSKQQHEILFWKVFKNIYIRDIILSSIHNNNKSKCHNSYNSTTSLELMLMNNKYNIILDKLKSNHHIHFSSLPGLYNNNIPIDKSKDIHQLLFNQYKDHFKRIDPFKGIGKLNQQLYIENYKLLYGQQHQHNNYNNYRAHSLFYSLLNGNNNNQNKELVKYLKQIIDNSNNDNNNDDSDKEYSHINKKQKISTSTTTSNNNNNRQDYIQQLISTSSLPSSPCYYPRPLSSESIKIEIIEAINNNKPIPISINHYYLNPSNLLSYYYQDIDELKLDIESFLIINHDWNFNFYNCIDKQEILDLVLLKLLYHHNTRVKFKDTYWGASGKISSIVYEDYFSNYYNLGPVDSLILAKIFCLNMINKILHYSNESLSSYLKFKQHLIDNQIGTLDELISAASDTFINKDGDVEKQMNEHFGIYYCYYKSTKPIQVKQCISSNITMSLAFAQSIINQSDEILNQLSINDLEQFIRIPFKRFQSKYINSVGSGFGSSDCGNQDESTKQRSTSYFNLLIKTINGLIIVQDQLYFIDFYYEKETYGLDLNKIYERKRSYSYGGSIGMTHQETFKFKIWIRIFEIIIFNYNAKLFEWLLESNKELQDIYYELLDHQVYNCHLLVAHTRINKESNQIDYEMFNAFIHHIINIEKKDIFYEAKYGLVWVTLILANTPQVLISLINHLTLLVSSSSKYNHPYILNMIGFILSFGFSRLESVDDIIQIYNQLNPIENKLDKDHAFNVQSKIQVSTVLILPLIKSINRLDIKSIQKIISAVLNNSNDNSNNRININIPTTIVNSLELIKYLFMNRYLNQFNDVICWIAKNAQGADKEFIMELVNTYIDNPNQREHLKKSFSNKEIEDKDVQLSIERLKYSLDNTQHQEQQQPLLSRDIVKCFTNGYYDSVYNFLNNNIQQQLDIDSTGRGEIMRHLQSHPISIEWFTKLYPVLFKRLLYSGSILTMKHRVSSIYNDYIYNGIKELLQFNHQIFEFLWDNYFNNDQERIKLILELLIVGQGILKDPSYHQIIEYILRSKREFIISSAMYSSLEEFQILRFHHDTLVYGSLSIYKQVRSIFPSYQFAIEYDIIRDLMDYHSSRYDVIEYLYENNLLPSLDQFINTISLEVIFIKEYDDDELYKLDQKANCCYSNAIQITKSMFILIFTIIKLQRQHQEKEQQDNDTNNNNNNK